MTEETSSSAEPRAAATVSPVPVQVAGEPPAPTSFTPPPQDAAGSVEPSDRPELVVGGAFAAGFVIAMILKRLAR